MSDVTCYDIVTDNHAIEVDFTNEWAETIWQGLNYSLQLCKKAGIFLVLEKPYYERHLLRVESIIKHFKHTIDVVAIRAWE